MGSMDWLTTVIGILYFGAVESNPFMAHLVHTNLPAFSFIKLGTAFFIGFLFYQADKILYNKPEANSKDSSRLRLMLRIACLASIAFLIFAVVNNVLVVSRGAF